MNFASGVLLVVIMLLLGAAVRYLAKKGSGCAGCSGKGGQCTGCSRKH